MLFLAGAVGLERPGRLLQRGMLLMFPLCPASCQEVQQSQQQKADYSSRTGAGSEQSALKYSDALTLCALLCPVPTPCWVVGR